MPVAQTSGGSRGRNAGGVVANDRRLTVFSPEGRLYQLEYAFNAVVLPGITSVGVLGADSVYVLTHRKKDNLQDKKSLSRLFEVTKQMGLLVTGRLADGRALADQARNAAAEFRFKWGYEMPPHMLAQWIADRAQICTQYTHLRSYGIVAMIFGIDEEKGTPELFTCDPAGQFFGHKAASAGLKEREAMNFLEEKMKSNPSLSPNSTFQMAVKALYHVLQGDFDAQEYEVKMLFGELFLAALELVSECNCTSSDGYPNFIQ